MIRRARPKFLTKEMIFAASAAGDSSEVTEEMYFNRGCSSLRFLLECIRARLERAPLVAVQSFNCISVWQAVLEAGCDVAIYDIKLDDFSMAAKSLASAPERPDVVLLLHYQGVRNAEHEQIAAFCRSNGITLVEDLAHSTGSAFPLLGHFGIYSFAFDKPMTCLAGGQLVCGDADKSLVSLLRSRYARLPAETRGSSGSDLAQLELMLATSKPGSYAGSDLSEGAADLVRSAGASSRTVEFVAGKRLLVKGLNGAARSLQRFRRERGQDGHFAPLRLRPEKVSLIAMQRREYKRRGEEYVALAQEAATILQKTTGLSVRTAEWNRLSILEPSGRLAGKLRREGVQAGNYNWPIPLHSASGDNSVVLSTNCDHSEHASRYIVNIPVWSLDVLPAIRRATQNW